MAQTERIDKSKLSSKREDKIEEEIPHKHDKSVDELKAETDALLDSIEELLEEQGLNTTEAAEAMIKGYQQLGGE